MSKPSRLHVFDKKHALARLGGLEAVLHDVMNLMTTETPKVHAEMGAALSRQDRIALRRSAHTLKGTASLVGAFDMVRRLKRIEDYAALGEFDGAAGEVGEVERQFAELQQALTAELQLS